MKEKRRKKKMETTKEVKEKKQLPGREERRREEKYGLRGEQTKSEGMEEKQERTIVRCAMRG